MSYKMLRNRDLYKKKKMGETTDEKVFPNWKVRNEKCWAVI